jgi:hypothetical protein
MITDGAAPESSLLEHLTTTPQRRRSGRAMANIDAPSRTDLE